MKRTPVSERLSRRTSQPSQLSTRSRTSISPSSLPANPFLTLLVLATSTIAAFSTFRYHFPSRSSPPSLFFSSHSHVSQDQPSHSHNSIVLFSILLPLLSLLHVLSMFSLSDT
ncbi:hypothetical protein BLNAU_3021 [Blattamonas nauphoetae]|uniref:Transmembrane protein n=1 Tax=Blattamonas nauphoetae TaxID=2049346 RepID=A0ABQ9YE22_9EUKA|nr:hypothetical protein BLNAU_3021 [Blattamonas nauphoetae]